MPNNINDSLTLTIVIPVYNEEDHIKACLDSIAAQTVRPLEVIIVDNNSTDNTVVIAKKYSFVRVLHESKQGIAFARNTGFDSASGDIIGRIDADSRLPVDWVKHMTDFIHTNPNSLLSGGSYFYDLKLPNFFGWMQGQAAFRVNRFIMGHYIAWGSNMAMHKKLWISVRNEVHNQPDIHEDMDLSIHLHKKGYEISYQAGFKVGIDSRLFSTKRNTRKKHMKYLKMWPRTLQLHKLKRAWLGWMGAYLIYFSYLPLLFLNSIGKSFFK